MRRVLPPAASLRRKLERTRRVRRGPFVGSRSARGIVLLVALALLSVLTLAVLAAAQTTRLELAMARNDEDASRAFFAAATALTEAQAWLGANVRDPAAMFTPAGSGGLFAAPAYGQPGAGRPDVLAGVGRVASAPAGVASAPRFVIEWLGARTDTGTPANPLPPAIVDLYRITALGTGASAATAVLQSTWAQTRDGGTVRAATGRLSWTRLGAG